MAHDNQEEQLQCAVVEHLRRFAPADVIWYHVPNGEKRGRATAGRLKAMGVVAGVPDLAFVLADGRAAFMELKRVGGAPSASQVAFQTKCERMGVEHAIVSNIDTALSILNAWGVLPDESESLTHNRGIL